MVDGSVQPIRARGEARSHILGAARELFAQNGFDGTTVRGVARLADVSEALVYRYYQSKQRLFDEAVTDVYRSYIAEFVEHWGAEAGLSNEQVVENYVRGLYDVVVENRDLFFALVVAGRFGHPGADSGLALAAELRTLAGLVTAEARDRGIEHVDIAMAVNCTTALVLAMVLLDDMLFEKGASHPDRERLVREMTRFASAGVSLGHPGADS